ncbi:MAG: hypothetical protein II919_03660 [Lachnospiraceae bacterium]|nr:hypothetical protein [Lachnospiraceae bacterium]
MKKLFLFHYLLLKRSFKKVSFIILLLCIPVLCYLLKDNFVNGRRSTIYIGVCLDENNELAKKIFDSVETEFDSFEFVLCKDADTLQRKVIKGTYDCGYVFDEHFDEKFYSNDMSKLLTCYVSPSSTASAIANEYIFSEIFNEHAFQIMINYIKDDEVFKDQDLSNIEEELRPIYDDYLYGEDTFAFEYISSDHTVLSNDSIFHSFTLSSIKGLVALLVMFAAFIGTLNIYKDDKTGIFFAFHTNFKLFYKMAEIFTITLIASASGLISIYLCHLSDGFLLEISRLLVYTLVCTIYFYAIYMVTPNQYIFATLIPVLVLGSIIFCPIFADLSEVISIPLFKHISWFFVPKYYFIM